MTMTLETFFREHPRAVLGFSGGVDSAYLLYAAGAAGAEVYPCFVQSPFQPTGALEEARALAQAMGRDLAVLELDTLADETIAANGPRRCYFCKKAIFSALMDFAREKGIPDVLDGTNASDDVGDRPGFQALRELVILSPLRESGLTKGDIRARAREAGLSVWDKPSNSCLATRVPTGEAITSGALARVDGAESALRALGFSDLRARLAGSALRLELPEGQLSRCAEMRAAVREALAPYGEHILLDLKGR
jgi:uncharacterized protein